ncbi:MAG: cytidylyltransferase domain-containing protein [bacterium]
MCEGMVVALIPARGGSKGVLGKNIRIVHGKPLISYAIECGASCPFIDHVVVSTDSQHIASVARKYCADVPFMRPAELAQDDTPMLPVIEHAIEQLESIHKQKVRTLILIDPTAPLRIPKDIEEAFRLFGETRCDAVLSACLAHRNPYFNMVKVNEDGRASLILESHIPIYRRQDAPEVYDLNTVVWIFSRNAIMVERARIPMNSRIYLVPPERSLDLDTEFDFELLEWIFSKDKNK